jgi:hypothetical protein
MINDSCYFVLNFTAYKLEIAMNYSRHIKLHYVHPNSYNELYAQQVERAHMKHIRKGNHSGTILGPVLDSHYSENRNTYRVLYVHKISRFRNMFCSGKYLKTWYSGWKHKRYVFMQSARYFSSILTIFGMFRQSKLQRYHTSWQLTYLLSRFYIWRGVANQ